MGSDTTNADAATISDAIAAPGTNADTDQRISDRTEAAEVTGLTGAARTRFNAIRNAAYHEDRERYFARMHKFAMLVTVLSGTTAFGAVAQAAHLAQAAAFVATVAGVLDLVFDLDGSARHHATLKGKYCDVLARCEAGDACAGLDVEMTRLYADERPAMHAVNALAFNAAVNALGRPKGQRYALESWQRFVRHLWPFQAGVFPTEDDLAAKSAKKLTLG